MGLLIVGVAVAYKLSKSSSPAPAAAPAAAQTETAPTENHPAIRAIVPKGPVAEAPAAPVSPVPGAVTTPESTPDHPAVDPKELMGSLTGLDLKGSISDDDAKRWKLSLQQLIRQGPSSVAAIQGYLVQNQDVSYAGVPGADQLGFASLRAGLLDALSQIGGPESTQAMLQVLQSTTFPTDVAALAYSLEQQSPGQYQSQILGTVRSQLSQAAQGQLGNANVGPLFQILASQAAAGVDVSADLNQYSSKWPYYSSIELANLPNAAGVPSLVQMALSDNGPGQAAATQALAQIAAGNKLASEALVNMVTQGQLGDVALAQLAPYLGGRDNQLGQVENPPGGSSQGLHIANGNQDFSAYDSVNTLTPQQATDRIAIIDQLLQTIPSTDTLAQQALQQQKTLLTGRTGK